MGALKDALLAMGDVLDELQNESVDFYAAMRSLWRQNRDAELHDGLSGGLDGGKDAGVGEGVYRIEERVREEVVIGA